MEGWKVWDATVKSLGLLSIDNMDPTKVGAETFINVSLMVGVGHTPVTLEGVGARIKRLLSSVL